MNQHIFLLLGTNVGNKMLNLDQAKHAIGKISHLVNQSSVYRTAAWGRTDQPDFYNQIIKVETVLEPDALLNAILSFEEALGRVREEKWGPRIIDIDILFYGERIVQTENLVVPHPGIASRRFVLEPLNEIDPLFIHPVLKKKMITLLNECVDELEVERI